MVSNNSIVTRNNQHDMQARNKTRLAICGSNGGVIIFLFGLQVQNRVKVIDVSDIYGLKITITNTKDDCFVILITRDSDDFKQTKKK